MLNALFRGFSGMDRVLAPELGATRADLATAPRLRCTALSTSLLAERHDSSPAIRPGVPLGSAPESRISIVVQQSTKPKAGR